MPGKNSNHPHAKHRVGGWLPNDHSIVERWMDRVVTHVNDKNKPLEHAHPVIHEFQSLIENDPELHKGFQKMFEEIPQKPPYNNDPEHHPQIRDYKTLLRVFDHVIQCAPDFEDPNGQVTLPLTAILDWPMGTPSGLSTFQNPKLNEMFKKMFSVWAEYLSSPNSREVLTDAPNGWFGPDAKKAIPDFAETFVCDPSAPYYGFNSWDDFFTRKFREGVRPIEAPDDDRIVNNACESTVYRIAYNVQKEIQINLKGQPYSLSKMLNDDELVPQFAGGTVYQAFLSATNYHRWASPVNGTVLKIVPIPGTYFAESPEEGFTHSHDADPSGENQSQAYLTSVAARSVIYIQADNPAIGLMAFVAIGMGEVSTCEVVVQPGQNIKKGDETGMFHFGGSTHCLVFRPGVQIKFKEEYSKPGASVKLNVAIATVE
ncbi:phosphatidylserine decarboxylase family protein [Ceratobasidium sp. AG-Ba]|nr:phosphatidylserine decarboxylase family protein [Ceratobasidium sp. AG-Ba]QRW06043.1 phosphatidylserine decarboxylase family protein [Ceratobasidium sp. AG-Ba]